MRRTMTVASQRMFGWLERWNNNQVTPSLSKPHELRYRSNTFISGHRYLWTKLYVYKLCPESIGPTFISSSSFIIIGRVASFKVIPTWLNNTVPAMFPLVETVLEITFRDGLEYARRIIFNRRFVIESLSFEWFFEFWKQPKVTGAMSVLYGGCRSNAILCLLINCCTRFDECAGALSWWRSQSPHSRESFLKSCSKFPKQ